MLHPIAKIKRIAFSTGMAVFLLLVVVNVADASTATDIQPASDVVYGERLRVNSSVSVADSSYYYRGIHLGSTDGTGGVIFANGSIINVSDGSIPVTFGDDMRIDGRIWRGPSAGPGDNFPVKIYDDLRVDGQIWGGYSKGNTTDGQSVVFADSVRPAEDNKNSFGSSGYRWSSGDFAGTVTVGNLGGSDVVTETNLSATNNPQAGYVLSYDSNGRFRWLQASGSSGVLGDSDWTGAGTGTMYATSTSDNVGIGLSSGLSGKLHVTETAAASTAIYGTGTQYGGRFQSSGIAALRGDGASVGGYFVGSSATGYGVFGYADHTTGVNFGGYFQSDSSAGTGVYGTSDAYGADSLAVGTSGIGARGQATGTSGVGVRGNATSATGTTYGGYFDSDSSAGTGAYGISSYIGSQGSVSSTGQAEGYGVIGMLKDTSQGPYSHTGLYGGIFSTDYEDGTGVAGYTLNTSGTNYGGRFETEGNSDYAVYAVADGGGVGTNYGGYFKADSTVGEGIYAEASNTGNYRNQGVHGVAAGWLGRGVYGVATNSSGSNFGVYGEATASSGGAGVYGTGGSIGVQGVVSDDTDLSGYFTGGSFQVVLDAGAGTFDIDNLRAGAGNTVVIDAFDTIWDSGASSRRYKKDIQNLAVNTADVLQLQPVSFTYKSSGHTGIGLIAEDVYESVPDLVVIDSEGRPDGVMYDRLPLHLLELDKEQQSKISEQEKTIEDQQAKITNLEAEVSDLKSVFCKYLPQEEICQ